MRSLHAVRMQTLDFIRARESTLGFQGRDCGEASVFPVTRPPLHHLHLLQQHPGLPPSPPACQRKRKSMLSLSIACQDRQQHVNHSSRAMVDWLGHWSKKKKRKIFTKLITAWLVIGMERGEAHAAEWEIQARINLMFHSGGVSYIVMCAHPCS